MYDTAVSGPDLLSSGRHSPPGVGQPRFRRLTAALALGGIAAAVSSGCAARSRTAVENAQTAVRVKTALVNDVEVGTLPIDVEAAGGVVTLAGVVRTAEQIDRAVEVARGVQGVVRVQTALVVGDPDPPVARPVPPLPALAPRPREGPLRLIGAGASVRLNNPAGDALAQELDIGPILRLRTGNGLGPAIAFNWTNAAIETSPTGLPALARVRIRPVMAGVQYGFTRGRLGLGASVVAGYAFNNLDIDESVVGAGRAVDVGNSFVWRPGATLWYDVTQRIGVNLFGGYLFTRPKVTFVSDASVETHRMRANAVVISVGMAYWIF